MADFRFLKSFFVFSDVLAYFQFFQPLLTKPIDVRPIDAEDSNFADFQNREDDDFRSYEQMSRISCFVISSQKTHSLSFLNRSIFFTQCEYRTSMRSTLTTQCFYLISSCVLHTKAQIMQNSQAAQQVQMMQAPHGLALQNSAPQYPVPVQNSPATGQNMQPVQNTQTSQNINYTSVVSQLSDTFLRKPPSINGKLIISTRFFVQQVTQSKK